MAEITRFLFLRHLRAEQSSHVLLFRAGRLVASGRGLAFWFLPLSASLAEVPVDDRELPFLFHGRSQDFQDVTVQGVLTWRAARPEVLAARVDFAIDPSTGSWLRTPLETVAVQLTQLAKQLAEESLVRWSLKDVLARGLDPVRDRIGAGLREDEELARMGLEIASVRISAVTPTADLEKALQMPARERLQQEADEATFQRRALAVEKERAIQENELQNQIELAAREENLIAQRGQNDRRRAEEHAQAKRIDAEAAAARSRIGAAAEAERLTVVEAARIEAEERRMAIHRDLPAAVMLGLAAQELASKLHTIEHLNVGPDVLGPMLTDLMRAGTRRLQE